ncbi:hypothetical protein CL621_01090 [archaeon]|nr:hypothetical protein [archaeon]|tara:strand:- start:884 stop:2065 length:1182 start_codon:yes stop_codon:yes gene_type:complete
MSSIKIDIMGSELKTALSYIAPAVGTRASAKQEPSLLYIKLFPNSNKLLTQVQSSTICAQILIDIVSTTITENIEFLLDYNSLNTYVKNNSKTSQFTFNLEELEEDIINITIGAKFLGVVRTVPIDAYEVISFKETTSLGDIDSKVFSSMIDMTCQFSNPRIDIYDYVQIVAKDNILSMFTQGDSLAKFSIDYDLEEDIDITVRASALMKIKKFESPIINLELTTDEYFLILKEKGIGTRAVVLHSDPPITLEEYEEDIKDKELDTYGLNWSVSEMDTVLRNVENSTRNGIFNFSVPESDKMVIKTENQVSSSTKMEIDVVSSNYNEELVSSDVFQSSIILFKKLGNLNNLNGKVSISFNSNDEDYETPYVEFMHAIGTVSDINYTISFNVIG